MRSKQGQHVHIKSGAKNQRHTSSDVAFRLAKKISNEARRALFSSVVSSYLKRKVSTYPR